MGKFLDLDASCSTGLCSVTDTNNGRMNKVDDGCNHDGGAAGDPMRVQLFARIFDNF